MDTFGSRLRGLREARGWSQEKLGFELEVTGATVSKWETSRAEPNLGHLELFLQVFAQDNVTLDWLVTGNKSGSTKIDKPRKGNEPSPRAADTQDEQALLARYRRLSAKKQKMLLGLLED
ncbi:helix-turn-helix domain-containing protein [Lysobacter capsici]|uniref:helix-turn-helix domain-containing protein n=1 Tax=Lysobacter capsici TaxID=435897 RepID=UPI001783F707|nr:helix-turn-helix transcriptional regulator [Lysobacter capsici]UOF15587.1 helix-turn-helix domain-containing protein [Lysobacter capsici]